jgi:hypothetical protein
MCRMNARFENRRVYTIAEILVPPAWRYCGSFEIRVITSRIEIQGKDAEGTFDTMAATDTMFIELGE